MLIVSGQRIYRLTLGEQNTTELGYSDRQVWGH